MKNMKIRTKLMIGFVVMIVIAMLVGTGGFIGMYLLAESQNAVTSGPVQALYFSEEMELALSQQRIAFRDLLLHHGKSAELEFAKIRLKDYQTQYAQLVNSYEDVAGADEYSTAAMNLYTNTYLPLLEEYRQLLEDGKTDQAAATLAGLDDTVNLVMSNLEQMVAKNRINMRNTQSESLQTSRMLAYILGGELLIAVLAGIWMALYNARMIATPTQKLVKAAQVLAQGDVNVQLDINQRDEIGVLAKAFELMIACFQDQARALSAMAGGDYSVEIQPAGENDVVGQAIVDMLEKNNTLMGEITAAAKQVALGASHVASGSQMLATGSSEQAATAEELSANAAQVKQKALDSAALSQRVAAEISGAGQLMTDAQHSMREMAGAMDIIESSSGEISKVIKIIDDIAFQTNILALNAAVEAARAGEHGKGFAVVADEVRNLAQKSAEAAHETASLIDSSVENVRKGTEISRQTGERLAKAGDIVQKTVTDIAGLREASNQQSLAINEINMAIEQITQVVQSNSATSEQSAASAEQLNAQGAMLQKIVQQFTLRPGYEFPAGHVE